jgi:NAD+ synthase (glutamine-hydrolysing)
VLATYCKRELPNYQVFDERRYFASGRDAGCGPVVFEVGGLRCGLLICEDAWFDEPAEAAKAAGAQVLCVLNASPFHLDKHGERESRMAQRARRGPAAALCPPGGRAGRGGVRRRLLRAGCPGPGGRPRAQLRAGH